MEITLSDRKQPDHRDYEQSGDLLMQDFQAAFEALEAKLATSEKAGSPEVTEELNIIMAAKEHLEKNLPPSMIEKRETVDLPLLISRVQKLAEKL